MKGAAWAAGPQGEVALPGSAAPPTGREGGALSVPVLPGVPLAHPWGCAPTSMLQPHVSEGWLLSCDAHLLALRILPGKGEKPPWYLGPDVCRTPSL